MSDRAARPVLAYVVLSLNPGGTERLAVDMARAFAREYDVQVVCLDEPGAWAPSLRRSGIPVHCLWRQPGLDLAMVPRLAALFREIGARIVHAHQCTPWFYAALSRILFPQPRLLMEEHGRFYPETDDARRRIVNRWLIALLTHRFVAVSEDVRRRLARFEGLNAERIAVIYNAVTAAPALSAQRRAQLRGQLGLSPDEFVVGSVGRLDPIKNLPMLVEAIGQAASRVSNLRGLLVGEGPERARIAAQIGAAGLAGRVLLTGHRDDARDLLHCMDLFVLSSVSEGTSLALLEAMSAGVPVAVTDVGGNPEIVERGSTGWLVPSGDVPALSAAIVQAASTPSLRLRYAAAARTRFDACFRFDAMIAAYRDTYSALAAGPAARRLGEGV